MIQQVCQVMNRDKPKEIHSVGLGAVKDSEDSVDLKDSMINSGKVVVNNKGHLLVIFSKNLRNSSVVIKAKEVKEVANKQHKEAKISSSL